MVNKLANVLSAGDECVFIMLCVMRTHVRQGEYVN